MRMRRDIYIRHPVHHYNYRDDRLGHCCCCCCCFYCFWLRPNGTNNDGNLPQHALFTHWMQCYRMLSQLMLMMITINSKRWSGSILDMSILHLSVSLSDPVDPCSSCCFCAKLYLKLQIFLIILSWSETDITWFRVKFSICRCWFTANDNGFKFWSEKKKFFFLLQSDIDICHLQSWLSICNGKIH